MAGCSKGRCRLLGKSFNLKHRGGLRGEKTKETNVKIYTVCAPYVLAEWVKWHL